MNVSDVRRDILQSDHIRTASLLRHQYFNTLRSLLDKHAPIKRKKYTKTYRDWVHEQQHSQGKMTQEEMSVYGAMKTLPEIVADTRLQSIITISCLRGPNVNSTPTLLLKIKEILRLCGIVSKIFYTGPLLLFYQTVQIKPTFL